MDDRPPVSSQETPLWDRISTSSLVRFLLFFTSGWALVTLLEYFEYVIFTFTIAAILALLLNYPVRYLERFLGRGAALGIVIVLSLVLVIVLLAGVSLTITTQLQQLVNQVVVAMSSSTTPLSQLQDWLIDRNVRLDLEPLAAQIRNALASSTGLLFSSLPSLLNSYITFIVILVVAFFMLIDGGNLWKLLLKLLPSKYRERFATAVQKNFLGFFQGQFLISAIHSGSIFIIFLVLQIPFALALAITSGVFNLIPGIGATLGITIVVLVILVQGGWLIALKVAIACVVLQQLQDNLLAPKIMQSTVHLNPVVVFFALLVGARIAGFLGVFLSVPIAGVIVSLLDIEEMQSGSPPEEP
ncbi:AI-2E family transporter [Leptolyngbya sp. 'hensonii']|uniref:AI-2E family transporter n=1 Tax=Leptolyngbya sp. 'hensonii' TaxID=1922337 RepID=UPI000950045D|nr:AI-2E family transporter [Leptolyngbya sp. 'hensonii']OLP16914.1 AI-2E family transporter [Leptolyngbya sp. 'hensonii']